MSKKPFKIMRDPEVGKTEILYEGEEEHLQEVHDTFPDVKSSEIYPSFEENYQFTFFFYKTEEAFLKKLHRTCKEKLPRPGKGKSAGVALTASTLKWIFITVIGLIGLWFIYMLVQIVFTARSLLGS
ncbi:MAG: hypothetical protein ABEK50_18405 [bacterium]